MDNSQLVFCKVENIDLMNEATEEHDIENFEYCEYCLGVGSVEIDSEEYECEYCDIIDSLYSDSDSDSDYVPDWSDEDTYSCCSEESDCGEACNEKICFCGSV